MESLTRFFGIGMLAFSVLLVSACNGGGGEPGGRIFVSGLAGDIVMVQRVPTFIPCCPTSLGCRETAELLLDEGGSASVARMVDESRYIAMSRLTGCVGIEDLACRSAVSILCLPPVGPVARGEITIRGGVACIPVFEGQGFVRVCNTSTIRVNIDGHWVSTTADQGDTASSVALSLANNINTHPTLKTKVAAVAFGNTVVVQALQQGFEFTYPWETSCDYVVDYFAMCSMWAKLSPIATLAPEEQ